MTKLIRTTKDKRYGTIVEEKELNAELVDYKGMKAYKYQEFQNGPYAYFPVERIGKIYDISTTEIVETIIA